MKVIVVHEDGDRESHVKELAAEIRVCVDTGTMRYQGVTVETQREDS